MNHTKEIDNIEDEYFNEFDETSRNVLFRQLRDLAKEMQEEITWNETDIINMSKALDKAKKLLKEVCITPNEQWEYMNKVDEFLKETEGV